MNWQQARNRTDQWNGRRASPFASAFASPVLRGPDPLAHPVDRGLELRRGGGAGRANMERRQGARFGWEDIRHVRDPADPGTAGKRNQPAAGTWSIAHQPAEAELFAGIHLLRRSRAQRADNRAANDVLSGSLGNSSGTVVFSTVSWMRLATSGFQRSA